MRRQRNIFLFSSATPITTLFSDHVDASRRPASLIASMLVHALVFSVIAYGILSAPSTVQVASDRYSVRHLDLRAPEERRAAKSIAPAAARNPSKAVPAAAGRESSALQQAIHAAIGPQTLLQPDLPDQVIATQAIPVPRILIWTPRTKIEKNIVAPQPAAPTSAETTPSVDAPSPALDLANLDFATSNTPSPKLPVLPGSTTPVVTHTPTPVTSPPSSTTQSAAEPTPTAILSLSDLRMPDGSITLPPVNETARQSELGAMLGSSDTTLQGSSDAKGQGTGSGTGIATKGDAGSSGVPNGDTVPPAAGSAAGNGTSDHLSTTQITLPRDGLFSSVIVGQNVNEQFPEIADMWNGRMAYTVYLHVGLARSWILQYSLPRENDAAAAGNANRLEAPWPYTIVRPNLSPTEVDAEALMIHGYVNQSGHFEQLSMVFPQACPQATFVLKSLEQWQFRPASQNGQLAKVEVLLIIPEEME